MASPCTTSERISVCAYARLLCTHVCHALTPAWKCNNCKWQDSHVRADAGVNMQVTQSAHIKRGTAGGSGPSAETDLEIYVWCSDQLLSLRKWAVCPQFTIIVVSMHNKNNMKMLNTFQIQYFVELFVSCFFVVAELFPGLSQDNVTFLAIESPIIDTWQFYIEPHMLHKTGNWSKRYAQNMRKSPLYIWHTNTRENITNPSIVI